MSNLVLFQSTITDLSSPALQTYIELINKDDIDNPIIFCDYCGIAINNNIPIFNSYYLRQHFFDYQILLDFQDLEYLVNLQNYKCIIIYKNKFHDISKLDTNQYILVDEESDRTKTIKDLIYEKV